MDAVALHQPHGAGVVVRPHRFARRSGCSALRNFSATRSSASSHDNGSNAPGALCGPVRRSGRVTRSGMMDALGVARDLGADHARGIGVVLRAAHPADGALHRAPRLRARRSTGSHADRRWRRSGSALDTAVWTAPLRFAGAVAAVRPGGRLTSRARCRRNGLRRHAIELPRPQIESAACATDASAPIMLDDQCRRAPDSTHGSDAPRSLSRARPNSVRQRGPHDRLGRARPVACGDTRIVAASHVSPATQPSSAAAAPRSATGNAAPVSMHRISALPAMISGTLVRGQGADGASMRQVTALPRLGRRRDRDHVVEAHHDVGDRDDAHRAPQMFGRLCRVSSSCSSRHESLIATQNSSEPPTSLRNGSAISLRDDDR